MSQIVVYLFGAGATHACVKSVGSTQGTLMSDLNLPLAEELGRVLREGPYADHLGLQTLVNNVIDEETDFEHLITFLDDSPSAVHRRFADEVRSTFEQVLRDRLEAIEVEVGAPPADLYDTLLDMYEVEGFQEILRGCLTLNYDLYMEEAVSRREGRCVDFGMSGQGEGRTGDAVELLKLHGSFGWEDVWPVEMGAADRPLWIPPGIQKAKERYPFNLLWGRARELLQCDVLRVVGCRLGPNDWDLISLLFTTRHVNEQRGPYAVEIVDAPSEAARVQNMFPYLEVKSMLEVEPIGSQLISEFTGGAPRAWTDLSAQEQVDLPDRMGSQNWFQLWMKHKTEAIFRDLGHVETERGVVVDFLEANV